MSDDGFPHNYQDDPCDDITLLTSDWVKWLQKQSK